MEIIKNTEGTFLKIAIEGRIDAATAPKLEAELRFGVSGITELYFDFEKLEYIFSAGLRALLSAQKVINCQGKMVVSNVNETVMKVF